MASERASQFTSTTTNPAKVCITSASRDHTNAPVDVVHKAVVELRVVGVLLDRLGGEGLAEELVLAVGHVGRDGQARRLPVAHTKEGREVDFSHALCPSEHPLFGVSRTHPAILSVSLRTACP